MNTYFVKRNEGDSSFHTQRTEEEVRELVARGQIKSDWHITLNTFGESFNHFTREPRTPANWISVGTFVEEKRGEERFETGFRPSLSEMVDPPGGGYGHSKEELAGRCFGRYPLELLSSTPLVVLFWERSVYSGKLARSLDSS